jgi:hypothetical protein
VQSKCVARREVGTVQGECKDANGFVRSCPKQVVGDVVTYVCPKSVDPDVAKAGNYVLFGTEYPWPEDQQIGVQDDACDRAADRAARLRAQLGESDAGASAADAGGTP